MEEVLGFIYHGQTTLLGLGNFLALEENWGIQGTSRLSGRSPPGSSRRRR
jgi:hypothetical protein